MMIADNLPLFFLPSVTELCLYSNAATSSYSRERKSSFIKPSDEEPSANGTCANI